ncbi:MAG: hypothetical protein Q4C82_09215 [Eubacteriales bacterium]|nr:hypothetical protein [Eubacteriales bacterium]
MDVSTMFLTLGVGLLLGIVAITIVWYVAFSYSHMKALNALGYSKPWLAWIPFGVYYACAEAVEPEDHPVQILGSFEVPGVVFRFWWVVPLVLTVVPISFGSLITLAMSIIFSGSAYAKMYAVLYKTSEKEEQVIGCVSGFLPIVAVVKFFAMR